MDLKLDLDELVKLRRHLHAHAEVSNQEVKTAQIIKEYVEQFNPDEIWTDVGGHGVIVLFKGEKPERNIGFRADLDALHIAETLEIEYASKTPHTAHKCGHDGHMTIVAGLAAYLANNRAENVNIYLIFQPAEETGEGAQRINKALTELDITLDYLFGLHNLPGFPEGQILSKKGTFAAASKGMVTKLTGRTSHAAEPEFGNSPVLAVADIITKMTNIHKTEKFTDLTLATVIHTELGEIAFGTTPGYAEIRVTMRAMEDVDMQKMTDLAEDLVQEQSLSNQLTFEVYYTDVFPSTENTETIFQLMKGVAIDNELDFETLDKPFKWSEDFGQYKKITKAGFFGLGSGADTPSLHDETYDFPDTIIESGIKMYVGLINHFNKNE